MNTRLVILVVGVGFLLCVLGIIGLTAAAVVTGSSVAIPDVLQNVTVGSLTLLGGILIPNKGPGAEQPAATR